MSTSEHHYVQRVFQRFFYETALVTCDYLLDRGWTELAGVGGPTFRVFEKEKRRFSLTGRTERRQIRLAFYRCACLRTFQLDRRYKKYWEMLQALANAEWPHNNVPWLYRSRPCRFSPEGELPYRHPDSVWKSRFPNYGLKGTLLKLKDIEKR